MNQYFLSVIIPVYNEAQRLPNSMRNLLAYLNQQSYSYEIVVVENGSTDDTYRIACEFSRLYPNVRVIQEQQKGKGLAVRRGMLEATGKYRFMCDVDFSMPIMAINRFFPPNLQGYDIAIASREVEGAVRYNEPAYRHLVGRIFNLLIRWLALPNFNDTQCGFKCFHSRVVDDLFGKQTIRGWTFDVEILFIAQLRGYSIIEVPISWYFNPDSKVNVLRDGVRMGLDLIALKRKARRGLYACFNEK